MEGRKQSESCERQVEAQYGDDVDIRDLTLEEIKSLDKDTAERLVRRAGRRVRWYVIALLGWSLSVAGLAIFTPADVLDRWPWTGEFVRQMTEWFPFLGIHARYSRFPQAVSFVKAASFASLAFATATALALVWRYRRVALASLITGVRQNFLKPTTELLFIFVFGLCLFGVWVLPGDPGFMKGFTTNSRLGLALIESTGLIFAATSPSMIFLSVYLRLNAHHFPGHPNRSS
jgi:hypothetical protein